MMLRIARKVMRGGLGNLHRYSGATVKRAVARILCSRKLHWRTLGRLALDVLPQR